MDSNSITESIKGLWVERYRPKTLEDIILPARTREIIESFGDEIPNLLFANTPGTGKSSLAKIIVNDILKCNYLYINASDESGIDTIRHKVSTFAQTKSFDGKIKMVVLDECLDGDTLVTVLADGIVQKIPIKNLDDKTHLVKTYNMCTDSIEWRSFNHGYQGEREVYEVEFENGEKIICTDNHKWYVKGDNGLPIRKKLIDIINEGILEIVTKVDDISILAHK